MSGCINFELGLPCVCEDCSGHQDLVESYVNPTSQSQLHSFPSSNGGDQGMSSTSLPMMLNGTWDSSNGAPGSNQTELEEMDTSLLGLEDGEAGIGTSASESHEAMAVPAGAWSHPSVDTSFQQSTNTLPNPQVDTSLEPLLYQSTNTLLQPSLHSSVDTLLHQSTDTSRYPSTSTLRHQSTGTSHQSTGTQQHRSTGIQHQSAGTQQHRSTGTSHQSTGTQQHQSTGTSHQSTGTSHQSTGASFQSAGTSYQPTGTQHHLSTVTLSPSNGIMAPPNPALLSASEALAVDRGLLDFTTGLGPSSGAGPSTLPGPSSLALTRHHPGETSAVDDSRRSQTAASNAKGKAPVSSAHGTIPTPMPAARAAPIDILAMTENDLDVASYGPPFRSLPIDESLPRAEQERRRDYNQRVTQAHRLHKRRQNRLSAQRSRAMKATKFASLQTDVESLRLQNRELASRNTELTLRNRQLQAENQRLANLNDQNLELVESNSKLQRTIDELVQQVQLLSLSSFAASASGQAQPGNGAQTDFESNFGIHQSTSTYQAGVPLPAPSLDYIEETGLAASARGEVNVDFDVGFDPSTSHAGEVSLIPPPENPGAQPWLQRTRGEEDVPPMEDIPMESWFATQEEQGPWDREDVDGNSHDSSMISVD